MAKLEAETGLWRHLRAFGHRGRGTRGPCAKGMVRRAFRMKEEGGSVGMVFGRSSARRCVGAGSRGMELQSDFKASGFVHKTKSYHWFFSILLQAGFILVYNVDDYTYLLEF